MQDPLSKFEFFISDPKGIVGEAGRNLNNKSIATILQEDHSVVMTPQAKINKDSNLQTVVLSGENTGTES